MLFSPKRISNCFFLFFGTMKIYVEFDWCMQLKIALPELPNEDKIVIEKLLLRLKYIPSNAGVEDVSVRLLLASIKPAKQV